VTPSLFAIASHSVARQASVDRSLAKRLVQAAVGEGFDHDRQRILGLIDEHEDIAVRTCRPGHLTGSAFVVDPSRMTCLMLFHTKLQRWLQPGGHADGDTNLAHVALREAEEETGIDGLRVVTPAIDVDIHRVDPPKEDAHLHLDVRYLVIAPAGSEPVGNHESQALRWVTEAELVDFHVDEGLRRMANAGFEAAANLG
jgi:8-oxo-dGTP pyrophosphatase MutT (NUDIX family)